MYQGDQVLDELLRQHQATIDAGQARALVAGVAAAALDSADLSWFDLVVPEAGPDLRREIAALRASLRQPRDPRSAAERMAALRADLTSRGLTGLIVPRADEHQGEYVPGRAQRLKWLTGFTGSAGLAVVLGSAAAVFVDGRYTLQVRDQVDTGLFTIRHLIDEPATDWIAETAATGERIGIDARLHTDEQCERFAAAARRAGATLVLLEDNPIDAVWQNQPPPPLGPIRVQDIRHAGRSSADKRAEVAGELRRHGADLAVLTQPDSIAWLLNIRGSDVPHTPLPLSFALIDSDGAVRLFVDRRKLLPGVREALGNGVSLEQPEAFQPALDGCAGLRVLVDATTTAASVTQRLVKVGAELVRQPDPCLLAKACKNSVELDGARAAHIRDGLAMVRFLAWLEREASDGSVGEIAASEQLEAFRRLGDGFRDLSFPSISGAGSNGAIVHYRAEERTERRLTPGELYLIDSGAQYADGTTDITRTVAIGAPSAEHRDRFTRVLKGHIAIATVRFPKGTTGSQIDVLARRPLWEIGCDYDHGTGHGVGSYLSVHEGPQRIAKAANSVALRPGMILSNEPGYYKTGAYGIRIENLVVVREAPAQPTAERVMLEFETLTLAPIDRRLIDPTLLSSEERTWIDTYHARVRATLAPLLAEADRAWLIQATEAI